jgi:small GTP-binding protein
MSQAIEPCVKLMLIGDSAAGKSSLLARYLDHNFDETFASTIGIDFRLRRLRVDGRSVKLQIWDTAGQERFRTITASYYRGAQGVLLVYDVSNRVSFQHLDEWHRECQRHAPAAVVYVVGTKSDQPRQVGFAEAEAWAAQRDCPLLECSAKLASSLPAIEALFRELTRRCLANTLAPSSASDPPVFLLAPAPRGACKRSCC